VPADKLESHYPRTLANLTKALTFVEFALIFDNCSVDAPYRHITTSQRGRETYRAPDAPAWLQSAA